MCFKNLREGRHGYKKKRALRNKAKRLRAQCAEAITIHNAWVDLSARLDADQLLSDSTSDTFPLQHLSSDTAPQSSVVPEAVREKAVRLSNVLERAREDIVLRQEEVRNLKNVLKCKVEYLTASKARHGADVSLWGRMHLAQSELLRTERLLLECVKTLRVDLCVAALSTRCRMKFFSTSS